MIWLNELQSFFSDQSSGKTAEMLCMLMRETKPVLLIGTIWPKYLNDLQSSGAEQNALKTFLDQRIHFTMAEHFSAREIELAIEGAFNDVNLESAIYRSKSDNRVTQNIAAGPQLLQRWQTSPSAFEREYVTAAVIAKLAGCESNLQRNELEMLSENLVERTCGIARIVTSEMKDDAFAFVTEEVHGAASLLIPVYNSAHQNTLMISDYLYQEISRGLNLESVPDKFWEYLMGFSISPTDLFKVGKTLKMLSKPSIAENWLKRAMQSGHEQASSFLAESLVAEMRFDEAEEIFQQALRRNPEEIWRSYSRYLQYQSRPLEAKAVLERALAAGVSSHLGGSYDLDVPRGKFAEFSPGWMRHLMVSGPETDLAGILRQLGREDELESHWERMCELDRPCARQYLAHAVLESDPQKAELLLVEAISDGEPGARYALARVLERQNRQDDLLELWKQGVDANEPNSPKELAAMFTKNDQPHRAEKLLRDSVDRRVPNSKRNLVDFLENQERHLEATRVLHAASPGDFHGLFDKMATAYAHLGDSKNQEIALERGFEIGEPGIWKKYARFSFERGSAAKAEKILVAEARKSNWMAIRSISRLKYLQGDIKQSESLLRNYNVDASDAIAMREYRSELAALIALSQNLEEAIDLLVLGVHAGESQAMHAVINLGELDMLGGRSMEDILKAGVEAGVWDARRELAGFLEAHNRLRETELVLRSSDDVGDLNGGKDLGRFLLRHGRVEEAIQVFEIAFDRGEDTVAPDLARAYIVNSDATSARAILDRPLLPDFAAEDIRNIMSVGRQEIERHISREQSSIGLTVKSRIDEPRLSYFILQDGLGSKRCSSSKSKSLEREYLVGKCGPWGRPNQLIAQLVSDSIEHDSLDPKIYLYSKSSFIFGDHQSHLLMADVARLGGGFESSRQWAIAAIVASSQFARDYFEEFC
ncbi:tetratricopeptide repeat protein [Kocuria palustris]